MVRCITPAAVSLSAVPQLIDAKPPPIAPSPPAKNRRPLREQADALARVAWLMAAPDRPSDPPETPGDDPESPRGIPLAVPWRGTASALGGFSLPGRCAVPSAAPLRAAPSPTCGGAGTRWRETRFPPFKTYQSRSMHLRVHGPLDCLNTIID